MATKARQQYFADEISLQKQRREFSLEDNIKQKIDSVEAGAQVNTIETVKVNGTALTPDVNKAVNVLVPDVIDNLYSTSTDDALSAKQGKVLYDYLQNIASRGRFLSNWNCATGLPVTNPTTSPYTYMAGDYYSISNVASGGGTNYRPDGSSYTIGQASTTTETEEVNVSDFYLYDGTNWLLLVNTARQIAVDSSLSTMSTNPVENRVVTNAINAKVGVSADNGNYLSDGAKIWLGTETDFNSIVSPDTNTMYIQYVSSAPSPTPGWQPGANTLAYRPLTDDYDDYSGNGYDFNSNSTTLTTVDGVKCCDLATSYCDANITITTLPYTIAFYCKIKNPSARGINVLFAEGGGWGGSGVWASTSNIYIRYGNVTDTDQTWSFTPDGDWHLYVVTFSATGGGLYIDGQLFQTLKNPQSDPDANGTPFYIGHDNGNQTFGNAYMGAVILEDKARSAQDVSDYYDLTKANYGIS